MFYKLHFYLNNTPFVLKSSNLETKSTQNNRKSNQSKIFTNFHSTLKTFVHKSFKILKILFSNVIFLLKPYSTYFPIDCPLQNQSLQTPYHICPHEKFSLIQAPHLSLRTTHSAWNHISLSASISLNLVPHHSPRTTFPKTITITTTTTTTTFFPSTPASSLSS